VSTTPPQSFILTSALVANITNDIVSAFGLIAQYGVACDPLSTGTAAACTLGDTIGGMVRLAFHDAVGGGGPNGLGGANGCADFSIPDSNGLQASVATYAPIAAKYNGSISIADLWVLGANLAIQYASTAASGTHVLPTGMAATPGALILPFRYGRQDQASCVGLDAAFLPSPSFNWTQIVQLFGIRCGMLTQEIVAILGAHSLGRCHLQNSGFNGGWTQFQSTFTNYFYNQLLGIGWIQNGSLPVWFNAANAAQQTLMLGVDVELIITPSSSCPHFNKIPSNGCTTNTMPGDPSAIAAFYQQSITGFYANFSTAFQKLTELQYNSPLTLANVGSALLSTSSSSSSSSSSTGSSSTGSSSAVSLIGTSTTFGTVALLLVSALFVSTL